MAAQSGRAKSKASPAAEASSGDAQARPSLESKAKVAKVSPAERIRALEEEIARIRQEEHDSRYTLITSAIGELNAMGYQYRLLDDQQQAASSPKGAKRKAPPAAGAPGETTQRVSSHYDEKKYCKLCREAGHDTKAHKNAGEFAEKAFTNEERARRGVLAPEVAEAFLQEQAESRHGA